VFKLAMQQAKTYLTFLNYLSMKGIYSVIVI